MTQKQKVRDSVLGIVLEKWGPDASATCDCDPTRFANVTADPTARSINEILEGKSADALRALAAQASTADPAMFARIRPPTTAAGTAREFLIDRLAKAYELGLLRVEG